MDHRYQALKLFILGSPSVVGKPCRWYHAKRPEREEMLVADLSREQDVLAHGIRSELVLSPLRRSVLVLVIVLERNVWFWCVRGRIDRASRCRKESQGHARQQVVWPTTGSHTLRGSYSCSIDHAFVSCRCSQRAAQKGNWQLDAEEFTLTPPVR